MEVPLSNAIVVCPRFVYFCYMILCKILCADNIFSVTRFLHALCACAGLTVPVHVSVFVRMRSHTEVQQRGGCGVLDSSLKSRKAASQPLQDDE